MNVENEAMEDREGQKGTIAKEGVIEGEEDDDNEEKDDNRWRSKAR